MSAAAAAERSIVTIVAADVVGSTKHILGCDPDDAQTFLDSCFENYRDAVEAFGGRLISYEGDGGIAIFGWPDALEDHADRACAAAWRLQHLNERLVGPSGGPVWFRLGVHSGLVGVRRLYQPGRSGWNAVGDVVNVAAKLQQAAPAGDVLVSSATVDLCRRPLALDPTSPDLGPQGAALQNFRLTAAPDLATGRGPARQVAPLVGRGRELLQLREALLGHDAGARVATVVGEAGIGKSRLTHALLSEAADQGWRTITVYGDAQTRASPFATALAILAAQLGLRDGAPLSQVRDGLRRQSLDAETLALVSKLLGASDPRAMAANQVHLVRALVRALQEVRRDGPLLLLVEDLHLVDRESQDVLGLLAAGPSRAAFSLLVTGRPEALPDLRELGGALHELEPLAASDMRTLAERLCPDGTPEDTLQRVIARADGVAFVLEEIARSISSESPGADLPPSVESAIHARLGRLSPGAKELAQALSLLGEQVELELLAQVADADPDELAQQLAELERFAFVHPRHGSRARLRHHILAEACANMIPRQRRIGLHRAALQALDAQPQDLPGRRLRLATHAEGAGEDPLALSHLLAAAAEARGTSAAASLNLIFDRAVAVIGRLGEPAAKTYVDFVLMAFSSMLLLGEFAKMRLHLPRVMALAREQQRPDKVSSSLAQLGMLCWFEGRYEEGRQATEEGRAIARGLSLPALVYSNQLMLANVLHGAGRIDRAIAELEDLVAFLGSEQASTRWASAAIPISTAVSFIGWIKADTDDLEDSLEQGRRGLEMAQRARDPYSEIMARNAIGRTLLHMGRHAESVACLEVAWDIAEAHGYDATKANLAGHMASALARLGRTAEAVAIAEGCFARRLHLRTGQMENVLLRAGHAEAVARAGRLDQGLALLEEALEIAAEIDNPNLLASSLDLRASLRALADPHDTHIAADRRRAAVHRRRIVTAPAEPA